ncbi:MAG: hypothetical protein MJY60_04235 [Bacteroidales bacterium]|nr:hypothetical protein [Bacteroidales bacterium]
MSYDIECMCITGGTQSCFGYFISSRRYTPLRFYLYNGSYGFESGYNANYQLGLSVTPYMFTPIRFKLTVSDTGTTIYIINKEGSVIESKTKSYSETGYTPNQTMFLFGRKISSTTIEITPWRGSVGRFKVYRDGIFSNCIADYIPCYYGGKFGFWDAIAKEFKTSKENSLLGYGSFWNTKGFLNNVKCVQGGQIYIDYRYSAASPAFKIPEGCTQIRFDCGRVDNNYGVAFSASDDDIPTNRVLSTAQPVVTNIPSNAKYIRISLPRSYIYNGYIYDETHGQYIWKGINVSD